MNGVGSLMLCTDVHADAHWPMPKWYPKQRKKSPLCKLFQIERGKFKKSLSFEGRRGKLVHSAVYDTIPLGNAKHDE